MRVFSFFLSSFFSQLNNALFLKMLHLISPHHPWHLHLQLESTLESWTQTITSVVEQMLRKVPIGPGPLAEIECWIERSSTLTALKEQLDLPVVTDTLAILTRVKVGRRKQMHACIYIFMCVYIKGNSVFEILTIVFPSLFFHLSALFPLLCRLLGFHHSATTAMSWTRIRLRLKTMLSFCPRWNGISRTLHTAPPLCKPLTAYPPYSMLYAWFGLYPDTTIRTSAWCPSWSVLPGCSLTKCLAASPFALPSGVLMINVHRVTLWYLCVCVCVCMRACHLYITLAGTRAT